MKDQLDYSGGYWIADRAD